MTEPRRGLRPDLQQMIDWSLYRSDGDYHHAVDVADRVLDVVEEALRFFPDPQKVLARVAYRLVPSREDMAAKRAMREVEVFKAGLEQDFAEHLLRSAARRQARHG